MAIKRFWLDMSYRLGLKRTDKLMIGNIDNQKAEYIDLADILKVLTSDDLPEGVAKLYLTPELKTKLENLGAGNYTLEQLAQYFYPVNGNPAGFLTSESGLAAAKIVGALAVAQIPGLDAGKIVSGILAAARIPNLAASKITSGEFDVARIPVLPASKFEGIALELGKYILKTSIGAANGVAGLDANAKFLVGNLPNIDASKVTSGIFAEGRIPDVFVRLSQLVDYYSKAETAAFTEDEKTKLAGLESPKWKGNYLTPAALRTAFPEGEAEAWHEGIGGWTADVDAGVGQLLQRYIWDASDFLWREQASGTGSDSAAQVKAKYESNPDTNALTDARKDKIDGLPVTVESTAGSQAKADAAKTAAQNYGDLRGDALEARILANENNKVDKDGAKVLSDENYSYDEKLKLAAIEDAKWKGNYPTIEALRIDYPEGAGQAWHQDKGGWIGDVDAGVGADVTRYIWDASDLKWVIQAGASTSETAASIKTKYESNLDTNAFTDAERQKVADAATAAQVATAKQEAIDASVNTITGNIVDNTDPANPKIDFTPGGNSYYDFSFKVDKSNRAWQGVGKDADFYYTSSDRDENFGLSNTLQKYNNNGDLVLEKQNAYNLTSPTGKFMSFGSTIKIEGFLLIPVYDFNGGGAAPYISRVAKFNADTLNFIEDFEIGGGVAESIWEFGGEYFVCYFDIMKIRKFNSLWVQQAEYTLSPALKPDGGYQAIFEEGGFWYMNWHGSNDYNGTYAPGLDKYSFDGAAFTYIETLDAPTYGSGQGVVPFDGKYYWVDRPADKIIVTTKLGIKVPLEKDLPATLPSAPTFNSVVVTNETTSKTLKVNNSHRISKGLLSELEMQYIGSDTQSMVLLLHAKTGGDTQIISRVNGVNKFLSGYDFSPIEGYRIYHYGFSKPVFFVPFASDKVGLNGITDPKASLEVNGGVKIANDIDAASATKAGTIRYRVAGTTSYCEMCMQTGASTYAWIIINSATW